MGALLLPYLSSTVLLLSVPMVVYTSIGGVQAVAWTDVKQMFVVVGGMCAAVGILLYGILRDVSFGQALHLAEVIAMALREPSRASESYPERLQVERRQAELERSMRRAGLGVAGLAAGAALLWWLTSRK